MSDGKTSLGKSADVSPVSAKAVAHLQPVVHRVSVSQKADASFDKVPRIVNGAIAGLVGVCCVFPIDLVKTRLQNQEIGPNGQRMYSGMFDCAKQTFRQEKGIFGLYRGAGVNLLLITPEKVIKLVGNDYFRSRLIKHDTPASAKVILGGVAGAMAGACQIIITTPMELLKIQQQDQGRTVSKASQAGGKSGPKVAATKITAFQSAKSLVAKNGIFGVYKGFGATAMRDIPFSAVYFPLFATLRQKIASHLGQERPPFYVDFFAGIMAGCMASLFVNPMDVVKTRLQTLSKSADEKTYKGITDCFIKILRTEGPTAFYKGAACRIMVIAPLFGIAQMMYFLGIAERLLGYPMPDY